MLRARASISAIVCSAVDSALAPGALATMTPRLVAAATSTLSNPAPARPTMTRSVPASISAVVTLVALRMIRAAAPGRVAHSWSGLRPSWTSTSWPASRRRSRARSANTSVTRTLAIRPLLAEDVGEAHEALAEIVVAERIRQPRVPRRPEGFSGDDGHVHLIKQQLGQLE